MREVLAVSWEMPPLSGPRAVQVTRTLRELARRGWRSRVICFGPRSTRYNQDFPVSLEEETGGAVQPIAVASPEEWFLFRALWRVCPVVKRLPDEKRVWVRRAVREGRRAVAAAPADLIVSFAQPWSDHLVGLRLHRETGLPWVAHFSDPWVDSPYIRGPAWQRRIWERMERDVVAHAARVVFVNRQTADRVMAKYPPEWRDRARVVPQGHDARTIRDAGPPKRRVGPLLIVYTGRFYDGVRTPTTLLHALSAMHREAPLDNRLHVTFVGGVMDRYQELASEQRLNRIVTFCGRRSPADALEVAATADVLLTIDAPSLGPSLYLPSKLVDYLPLEKPILGLTPSEGASADLLIRLGYPTADPADREGIVAALRRLLDLHENGRLAASPQHRDIAREYAIAETTRAFEGVLAEALEAA